MAIIIPSKYIYEKQTQKVIDNVIERIEVKAQEVLPDNQYETSVYNNDFNLPNIELGSPTNLHDLAEGGRGPQDATETKFYHVFALAYVGATSGYSTFNVSIPVVQGESAITRIFYGLKGDEENIKTTTYCTKKVYDVLGVYNIQTNTYRETSRTLKSETSGIVDLKDKLSVEAKHSGDADGSTPADASVSLQAKNNSNVGSITPDYSLPDYIKLNELKIISYVKTITVVGDAENVDKSAIREIEVWGTLEEYTANKIELTIYGNTVGINLKDKTVYCGDINEKKVHAIEGNELMQTSNKYETGATTDLREGIDYTARIINDAPDGVPFAEIHISSFEEGSLYLISYKSDGYVYYKVADRYSTTVDAGGYYIDWVKVYKFHPWYYGTQKAYQSGKETATITCAASDYYDESGNKMISQENSELPMVFNLYDKVIPMVYGTDGKDYPLSQKVNTAKVFQVLGIDFMYDGEPLQKLYLQEVTSEDY